MALRRDVGEPVGAYRIFLLLQGTRETDFDIIDEKVKKNDQIYKLTSSSTTCLLSDPPVHINLVGYCKLKDMLKHRLDTETALVLVSSVTINDRVCPTTIEASVEDIRKVSKDEVGALKLSMNAEWKTLLVQESLDEVTPQRRAKPVDDPSYWSEVRQAKMRRIQSEPKSPSHS